MSSGSAYATRYLVYKTKPNKTLDPFSQVDSLGARQTMTLRQGINYCVADPCIDLLKYCFDISIEIVTLMVLSLLLNFCFVLEGRVSVPGWCGTRCVSRQAVLTLVVVLSCLGILSACSLGVSPSDSWWVFSHVRISISRFTYKMRCDEDVTQWVGGRQVYHTSSPVLDPITTGTLLENS